MTDITREHREPDGDAPYEEPISAAWRTPLSRIHRQLRGRYLYVLLLATVLEVAGAMIGFRCVSPAFTSTGLIRIAPTLPTVLYTSDENQAPPMFDSYVSAQAALLQSPDMLREVLRDPALKAAGWPAGADGVSALKQSLTVGSKRGEQLIRIQVTQPDRLRAQAAVNAVLRTFAIRQKALAARTHAAKQRRLVEREQEIERGLQEMAARMREAAGTTGTDDVDRVHAAKVRELASIDHTMARLKIAPAMATVAGAGNSAVPALDDLLGPGRTATSNLREREIALEAELASWGAKFKERHPMMIELRRQLVAVRTRIRMHETGSAAAALPADDDAATLDRMRSRYEALRAQTRDEVAALARTKSRLAALRGRSRELETKLAETRRRLDELQVEGSLADTSRISIAAMGDLPMLPVSDRRRRTASVGAVAGLFVAVGLVFLFSTIQGRCRFAADLLACEPEVPLLGVVPECDDGDSAIQAAVAVHRLRSVLQVRAKDETRQIFTVAGPTSDEGRASLALAMAVSFATTGLETLVVDVDLAGRGLTARLRLQGEPGVCQALRSPRNGHDRTDLVHPTSTPMLSALPAGGMEDDDLVGLTPGRLRRLIAALRQDYEVIIIDAGPILESLEATMATVTGGPYVLVVARGQRLRDVRASLDLLDESEAACAGFVLDRAAAPDCRQLARLTARTTGRPEAGARKPGDHEVALTRFVHDLRRHRNQRKAA